MAPDCWRRTFDGREPIVLGGQRRHTTNVKKKKWAASVMTGSKGKLGAVGKEGIGTYNSDSIHHFAIRKKKGGSPGQEPIKASRKKGDGLLLRGGDNWGVGTKYRKGWPTCRVRERGDS